MTEYTAKEVVLVDNNGNYLSPITSYANQDLSNLSEEGNSKFSDTDLSNISDEGKKVIDGQWITVGYDVASDVSMSSSDKTYDISNIIPNDGYMYELLLTSSATTGTSSGNRISLSVRTGMGDDWSNSYYLNYAVTRTTSNNQSTATSIVLLASDTRSITVSGNTSPNGKFSLGLRAYRRLGTNQ